MLLPLTLNVARLSRDVQTYEGVSHRLPKPDSEAIQTDNATPWGDLSATEQESLSGGVQTDTSDLPVVADVVPTAAAREKIKIRLKSYDW